MREIHIFKRYGIPSLLTAAAVLIVSVWITTKGATPPYSAGQGRSVMKDIEVTYYREEQPEWRAEIKEALFLQDETGSEIRDVDIYYFKSGLSLNSKRGFYDMTDGRLRLDGTVNGRGKGFVFTSPELLYIPSEDMLTAPRGLVIKGDGYTISGRNGRIKDSQIMEVTGDVRAVFY